MNIRKVIGQILTIVLILAIFYAAFALMSVEPDEVKAQAIDAKNSAWEEIKSFFSDGFNSWSTQFDSTKQQALPTPDSGG